MPWYRVEIDEAARSRLGVIGLPYYVLLGPDREIVSVPGSSSTGLAERLDELLAPN